ncbi:MAG: hypothetical protein QXF28_00345 [Nitrososphaerota archaeon]
MLSEEIRIQCSSLNLNPTRSPNSGCLSRKQDTSLREVWSSLYGRRLDDHFKLTLHNIISNEYLGILATIGLWVVHLRFFSVTIFHKGLTHYFAKMVLIEIAFFSILARLDSNIVPAHPSIQQASPQDIGYRSAHGCLAYLRDISCRRCRYTV